VQAAAQKAVAAATRVWAGAQAVLDAVMDANPIALIIIAIIALVAAAIYAYTHFKTFRDIVNAAWHGIQVAALAAWNYGLKPVWDAIRTALPVIGRFFVALWTVAVAAWHGIVAGVTAAWGFLRSIFSAILGVLRGPMSVAWTVLANLVKIVWIAIQIYIKLAWKIIKLYFDRSSGTSPMCWRRCSGGCTATSSSRCGVSSSTRSRSSGARSSGCGISALLHGRSADLGVPVGEGPDLDDLEGGRDGDLVGVRPRDPPGVQQDQESSCRRCVKTAFRTAANGIKTEWDKLRGSPRPRSTS
jgi:hypothetical protein